ncbi:MAG: hypothetical protein E6897_06300 [Cutibacterium avidum]|nr:hypothetical protein [Cutibacterium avidum]
MTDTFQISEDGDKADTSLIPANNARIETQLATPIRVIVGKRWLSLLCGSPQIVEGLRLRGVRDGRRGGLLVIDR